MTDLGLQGHATVEHVVSGPGLANTYRFLCESKGVAPIESDPAAPDGELQKTVAEKALAKTDPICEEVQWLRHQPFFGVFCLDWG